MYEMQRNSFISDFINLHLQVHHANLIKYMIVQICIQFDEILFKIHDALIDLLFCSFKLMFCLKVTNFRIIKFSTQVFSVVLSIKFLIMIVHAHHMILSLIARLLWQVWCRSLQLLLFRDEIKWHCNYEVFAILQSEHQEIIVHDALLFRLVRLISTLACITLIVIITMLMLMIKNWLSLSLEFWYAKLQNKQYILHFQIF